jgi:peroxiredoxin
VPAFTLAGMEGGAYSVQEALARGPLLVAFFKASCPTCQYIFPFIERIYQQFRERGIQVWGVSQDSGKNSRSFTEEFEVTFPILIDDHPYEVSDAYGLTHVPTLFLIDRQGQIVLTTDGFDKRDLLAVHQWFAGYSAASPPPLFLPSEKVPEFKPG